MGIRERFKKAFSLTGKKEEKFQKRSLEDVGISVVNDEKLEHRIELLMEFEDAMSEKMDWEVEGKPNLEKYCEILKARTNLLHHAIYQIALPYARAGDKPQYARMIRGWTQEHAIAMNWILEAQKLVQAK